MFEVLCLIEKTNGGSKVWGNWSNSVPRDIKTFWGPN